MSEDTTLLGRKGVGVDPREMTGEQLSNVFLDYEINWVILNKE